MQNFMLFVGDYYYPLGGMEDFVDSFATLDEALAASVQKLGDMEDHMWAHVFSISDNKIVYSK